VADENPQPPRSEFLIVAATVAAWLLPGLGHLLLRKWARAATFFACVAALVAAGLLLRGNIFTSGTGDLFDLLGYLADLGAGVLYFYARTVENGGADVSRAAGDYGTRFFATAGVLNLLCVLDAYQIAAGKKE